MTINSAKELEVYQASYELAMEIFELSKSFPSDEKYALTSQIRTTIVDASLKNSILPL